jgi:hypothetical protein
MHVTGGPGIIPFELAGPARSSEILRRWGADGRRAARAAVQIVAGACNAVENAALLGGVARGGDARLASIAQVAARTKFAGLLAGWLYGAAALVSR